MNSWRRQNCRSRRCSRPSRCSSERGSSTGAHGRYRPAGALLGSQASFWAGASDGRRRVVARAWTSRCYPDGRIRPSVTRANVGAPIPSAPSRRSQVLYCGSSSSRSWPACAARRVRVDGPWQIQVHPRRGRDRHRRDRGARRHRVRSSGCHERVADRATSSRLTQAAFRTGRRDEDRPSMPGHASSSAPRCSAHSVGAASQVEPPVPFQLQWNDDEHARLDRPDERLGRRHVLHGHGRRRGACRERTAA